MCSNVVNWVHFICMLSLRYASAPSSSLFFFQLRGGQKGQIESHDGDAPLILFQHISQAASQTNNCESEHSTPQCYIQQSSDAFLSGLLVEVASRENASIHFRGSLSRHSLKLYPNLDFINSPCSQFRKKIDCTGRRNQSGQTGISLMLVANAVHRETCSAQQLNMMFEGKMAVRYSPIAFVVAV